MSILNAMYPDPTMTIYDKPSVIASIQLGLKKTIEYMDSRYWNDKTVCLEIAQRWGKYSQFFSDELKNDADVMSEAVKNYPYSQRWATENAKRIIQLTNKS